MKVLFGQGNPGSTYANTRHNIGWTTIVAYANAHSATFTHKAKFFADVAEITRNGEKVLLVVPQTFYNEVGKSARAIMDFYKLSTEDILVLHDDVALPWGSLRIRNSGSDAGNNGIKSYNAHIGPNYWRVRIGIQPLHPVTRIADYVLGVTTIREREIFTKVFPEIITQINAFIDETIAAHSISVATPLIDADS